MPPSLDPEVRRLMVDVTKKLGEHEPAIKQLEERLQKLTGDVDKKLGQVRALVYDPNGNYRGLFGSEDQARTFSLFVLRCTGSDEVRRWAQGVIDTDHKSFSANVKDITGVQALLPHEHVRRLHQLVEDSSVWAGHAYRQPMTSEELSFTRRVSGFRARRSQLRQALSKQDVQVAPINLNALTFDILTSYPKQIADDALIPLAELMIMEMVLGFSLAIEEDGMIGDGSDSYDNVLGIVTLLKSINGVDDGGGLVLADGAAGAGWGGITKDNILEMVGRARYTRPGKTIFSGSNEFFWQVLAPIITAAGGVTKMEMEEGFTLNVFGVPYKVSHVMPRSAGNSQVPLICGDIGQSSTMGDRQKFTIETSNDVYFASKEFAVLSSMRVAINNHSLGDDTTPGPVVGLITPPAA